MCAQEFGDNKNKREVLLRSGSFAVIIRELVIPQAMKNDFANQELGWRERTILNNRRHAV